MMLIIVIIHIIKTLNVIVGSSIVREAEQSYT